ncbi:MAG: formate/nitrite transporter family protein [Deltaproteobacteria bacterium]|nr:formate/nitrite transporter family protein [Deltaproteobacteria bacterium]
MDGPSLDAYTPAQMAARVEQAGVGKANLDAASLFALAVLAGAFISLGAAFSTVTIAGIDAGFGITRLLGGLTFCLGLILVVVAGAELFTGNNLIVMAWVSGKVSTGKLLRNWGIVYAGNLAGALATALAMTWARSWLPPADPVGLAALKIAQTKASLPFMQAFVAGVFCNALVCLAVWLCFSARTTTDKILSILFPITAFVALGFEHSIANMYFIPLGIFLASRPALAAASAQAGIQLEAVNWSGFLSNLVPVTAGNILGGALLVGGVYWFIYLRKPA